jgi:hypothetical protein
MGVKRTTNTATTSPKQIALAERRALVLEYRRQGFSFVEIGGALRISAASAYRDCAVSLATITAEPARDLLELELLRLDDLQMAIYGRALGGDLDAINACLKILDQRAKLLGLYRRTGEPSDGTSIIDIGIEWPRGLAH